MKHWCKNCHSIFELGDGVSFNKSLRDEECPFCFIQNLKLIPIPDHETPLQYEKRTGNPYPDDGTVWVRCDGKKGNVECIVCGVSEKWKLMKNRDQYYRSEECVAIEVIADPPPPDDWRPK